MKSTFLCPSCKRPLETQRHALGVSLWCGHGPCASVVANEEDFYAGDEKASFEKLKAAVEKEQAEMEQGL